MAERVYIVKILGPNGEYLANEELFDEVERGFQHACSRIKLSVSGQSAVIEFKSSTKMERAFAMYEGDIEVIG